MLDAGHRLTTSQALLVGLEAARGLDYAHQRELVRCARDALGGGVNQTRQDETRRAQPIHKPRGRYRPLIIKNISKTHHPKVTK